MNEAPEAVKVFFEGQSAPVKPKVRPWHWISYYAYNLARKPKVWRWKREQSAIYAKIRDALRQEVFPQLYQARLVCPNCRNAYGTLRDQAFISSIRMILKNMRCEDHSDPYDHFLAFYQSDFDRNDELAAMILGFKK